MSARKSPAWHPWNDPKPGETKPPRPDYSQETERLCQTCGETKPLSAFTPNRPTGGRREVRCKACYRAREDRAKELARKSESRRKNARTYNAGRRKRYATKHALPTAPNRWWTCVRAAMELNVTDQRVRQLVAAGKLVAIKTANYPAGGLVWRIDPASVAEMKKRRGLA